MKREKELNTFSDVLLPLIVTVLVAMILFMPLCRAEDNTDSGDRDWEQKISDAVLDARIETAFALNDSLSAIHIDTEVRNGVVVLNGTVKEASDIDFATELANSFNDTKEVINNLKVAKPDETKEAERPEWREKIDNSTQTANIKRRLAYYDGLGTLMLDIDSDGPTVTVEGTVDSEQQKEKVLSVIRDTKGVQSVTSKLTVNTEAKDEPGPMEEIGEDISDEWVEKRVESSLMMSQNVSFLDLDVEVDNKVCVLTGVVSSQAEKDAAERIAEGIGGVDEIVNKIRVVD